MASLMSSLVRVWVLHLSSSHCHYFLYYFPLGTSLCSTHPIYTRCVFSVSGFPCFSLIIWKDVFNMKFFNIFGPEKIFLQRTSSNILWIPWFKYYQCNSFCELNNGRGPRAVLCLGPTLLLRWPRPEPEVNFCLFFFVFCFLLVTKITYLQVATGQLLLVL